MHALRNTECDGLAAGIGIGLFFFGVAEPIQHYEPCYGPPFAGPEGECRGNRYALVCVLPRYLNYKFVRSDFLGEMCSICW
jgi:hypothetical protein